MSEISVNGEQFTIESAPSSNAAVATLSTEMLQERIAAPSTWTVQHPHRPRPQPKRVAVSLSSSSSTHNSGVLISLPRSGGANHANGHGNWAGHREVGFPSARG